MSSNRPTNKPGYTLIEVIVTLSLIAIISLGLGTFIVTLSRAYVTVARRNRLLSEGRWLMNRVLNEIRHETIGYVQQSQYFYFIKRFGKGLHDEELNDGFTNFSEGLAIRVESNHIPGFTNKSLYLSSFEVRDTPLFTYLDSTGEVLPYMSYDSPIEALTRSVRVRLTLVDPPEVLTLESAARIRMIDYSPGW